MCRVSPANASNEAGRPLAARSRVRSRVRGGCMASSLARRLLHVAPVIGVLAFLLSDARPAQALMCFQDLRVCYYRAAVEDTYWAMWYQGMDCELTFTDCTRRALIGR